ncbi:hypothetical protein DFH09DRAFT_1097320 [Mycena vulgaris]|nr:hypothetical protein DFH09DRAFT_1097320 [Mycena vulgaris]
MTSPSRPFDTATPRVTVCYSQDAWTQGLATFVTTSPPATPSSIPILRGLGAVIPARFPPRHLARRYAAEPRLFLEHDPRLLPVVSTVLRPLILGSIVATLLRLSQRAYTAVYHRRPSDGWLWPEAKKPRLFDFGTKAKAKPKSWPEMVFGPALHSLRPKPGQKAVAFEPLTIH